MTDHEIDELAKREWTHEEFIAWDILPLRQRETANYLKETGFPGGTDQAAINQSIQKSFKKLRESGALEELRQAYEDYRAMIAPVNIRRDRRRRVMLRSSQLSKYGNGRSEDQ